MKKITILIGIIAVIALGGVMLTQSEMTKGFFGEMFSGVARTESITQNTDSRLDSPAEINTHKESTSTNTVNEASMNDTTQNTSASSSGTQKDAQKSTTPQDEGAMVSTAPADVPEGDARSTVMIAGGCFWCVEADLEKLQGVLTAVSGYAGGDTENPTYGNYAEGGHREVVLATYNPTVVSYREIVISALKHMDPTDKDGSFHDRGVQYSPAIYYETEAERQTAEDVIAKIDALDVYEKDIAAPVIPEPTFWKAEDYHQDYYKGLSSLKYKFYRNASGRDDFIEEHWGENTGPTLPGETTPFDVSQWRNFKKPSEEALAVELSDLQYSVTQKEDTESAFNNTYWDNKAEGIYVDVVSGEPLYSSTDKFDSGTGWPSFTKPIYPDAVTEHTDYKLVVKRTEVRSRFADSHLGHIFNDAPAELGGVRHCINSAALRFVPRENMEEEGYGQFLSLFQ